MSTSKLMKVTYYDPKSQIRLLCYADTVVWDTKPTPTLTALRFGGYPERVQGLADAIYGGAIPSPLPDLPRTDAQGQQTV